MKQLLFILLSFLATATCGAQEYEPTLNWPYIFDDFKQGIIYLDNGTVTDPAMMNIHLDDNHLQCINAAGKISRVVLGNIDYMKLDNREFRYANGILMECLYRDDNGMLMKHVRADFEYLLKNRTPYGLEGRVSWSVIKYALGMKGLSNERYDDIRPTWYDGAHIPLLSSLVFVIDGKVFPATQKGCNNVLEPAQRKELKAFIKSAGFDWHNTADLIRLMAYMRTALAK